MLLWGRVNSVFGERDCLVALLAAVEDPPRAATLPAEDATLRVAREHRLSPLLSTLCADTLPAPLAHAFRHDRVVTTARSMVLGQVAEECVRALVDAGVPTVVLKGLAYETRLYPSPGSRPTSDVDLLVPNDKRRTAFGVLDQLGFEPRAAAPGFDDADYHEVAWGRRGIEIDLHLALAPFARCRIDYAAVWGEARPFRLGQTDAFALAPSHAAIFHALHMAIDHFAVPAIYLVDMARMLATSGDRREAEATARAWHCRKPLVTALALTAALLPKWAAANHQPAAPAGLMAARVVTGYGSIQALPRAEQLLRKLAHFDAFADAFRYVVVQSRRNLKERFERNIRRRSPRERLAL